MKKLKTFGIKLLENRTRDHELKLRYRAQFLFYLMRYQDDFQSKLANHAKKNRLDSACVGVHIRRSANPIPDMVVRHMDKVAYHYESQPYSKNGVRRCVYISTDERKIIDEFIQK